MDDKISDWYISKVGVDSEGKKAVFLFPTPARVPQTLLWKPDGSPVINLASLAATSNIPLEAGMLYDVITSQRHFSINLRVHYVEGKGYVMSGRNSTPEAGIKIESGWYFRKTDL